jgi:hypothetical protein
MEPQDRVEVGPDLDVRLVKGLRPFGIGAPPPVALPTRRAALQGAAAAAAAGTFATNKGNLPGFNTPTAGGTPDIIKEQAAGSFPNTTIMVQTGTWTAYQTDRPVILVNLVPEDAQSATQNFSMGIWWNYGVIPSSLQAGSYNWSHAGVAYLSSPGLWYIRAQSGGGTSPIALTVIDAYDFGTAFRWLSAPGANQTFETTLDISTAGSVTTVLSPLRGRIAARIQNVGAGLGVGAAVRMSFNQAASYLNTGAPNSRGWRLPFNANGAPGDTVELRGDMLNRGTVYAILEVAPGNTTRLEVLDYYDWT